MTNIKVSPEPYDACPYCFAEISQAKEISKSESIEISENPNVEEKVQEEMPIATHKDSQPGCNHHLGYLSEREPNPQIPDECFTCKEIVQCMLKKT